MGVEANSQRNKLHLPRAKGGIFTGEMESCEGEDAKITFYDLFYPLKSAKTWNSCLYSSKLMAYFV